MVFLILVSEGYGLFGGWVFVFVFFYNGDGFYWVGEYIVDIFFWFFFVGDKEFFVIVGEG